MTRLRTLTETIQNLRQRYYTLIQDIFTHANQIINLATQIENEKDDETILYTNIPIIIQSNMKIEIIFEKLNATIQKIKESIQNLRSVQEEERLWTMGRDDICKALMKLYKLSNQSIMLIFPTNVLVNAAEALVMSSEQGLELLTPIQIKLKTPRSCYPDEKTATEDLALILHFEHTNEECHAIDFWNDLIVMELSNENNGISTVIKP